VRTHLLRLGFEDSARARDDLARLGDPEPLVALLARTADPDQALAGLVRLAERAEPGFVAELAGDEGTAMRLLSVLGASLSLTDHLCRHPDQWRELADPFLGSTRPAAYAVRDALLRAVGADPTVDRPTAALPQAEAVDALRVEYRRLLTRLAARDLAHHLGVDDASAELSDLAAGTLEGALAIARSQVDDAGAARLAVIALGKCGGHELNYVSDVDVLYVFAPAAGAEEA
jgi:[glutamine synthetase] adenylyltransferase / [glutamine synthetase]-adenylyl-L-tyrosine phosphorylase